MPAPISVGDEAPNFDLTSTEGGVLMLRDEVTRTAAVLYLFGDPESDRTRRDLAALAANRERLARLDARPLAVAPLALTKLAELQRRWNLPFPLLADDRGFARLYGVEPPEEGRTAAPALVVVDRRQRVRYLANPVSAVEAAMPELEKILAGFPTPTASYPKAVLNRWIEWWVNALGRGRRAVAS
jgi:peroxiredoxin